MRFHPRKRSFMLTGSEDGLMCFFDTEVSIEEDVSVVRKVEYTYEYGRLGGAAGREVRVCGVLRGEGGEGYSRFRSGCSSLLIACSSQATSL